MPRQQIGFIFALLCFTIACSPRDFLTRRLATDLIAGSDTFKTTQVFWLRTGVLSGKDYSSQEYATLRRHGWITGTGVSCPADLAPPCWDVVITPLGVDTLRDWVNATAASSQYISVPVAQRELLAVTGIRRDGNVAYDDSKPPVSSFAFDFALHFCPGGRKSQDYTGRILQLRRIYRAEVVP